MRRNVKGWLAASLLLVAVMGTGCLTVEVHMPAPRPTTTEWCSGYCNAYTPSPAPCSAYCQAMKERQQP